MDKKEGQIGKTFLVREQEIIWYRIFNYYDLKSLVRVGISM